MDRVLNRGHKRPTVTLVVGMAGSGKTSIVTCLKTLHEQGGESVYTINLDPAVRDTPYNPNIDIRDTVDYDGIRKNTLLAQTEPYLLRATCLQHDLIKCWHCVNRGRMR